MHITQLTFKLSVVVLLNFITNLVLANEIDAVSFYKEGKLTQYKNPEKALILYNKSIKYFEQINDTNTIADIKLRQMGINSGLAKYQTAYDIAWSLQPYLESDSYINERIDLNLKIITLYLIYEQYNKADTLIKNTHSIVANGIADTAKQQILQAQIKSQKAWSISENTKQFIEAENLILDCIKTFTEHKLGRHKIDYTSLHLAQLYITMDKLDESYKILSSIENKHLNKNSAIKCLLYEYLGRYNQKLNNDTLAISYYKKAINAIDKHNAHISNKVKILQNLSDLYQQNGNFSKAYDYLKAAKNLNELVFSSTSEQNKKLFEIKDAYKTKLKENEASLDKQQLKILQQEKQYWLLQMLSASGLFIFLLIIAIVFFRRRNKQQKISRAFEAQKQTEILEIKNKELLSSALQLLERDTQQEEIKKKLESISVKDENAQIIKKIVKTLGTNKSQKWEEFNTHFTAVNTSYYAKLKLQFPNLTATDLKICAFIKLGFSSKEMAQIMGVGVEGLNTSRSRLRKKMDLRREVVLVEYLQNF